MTSEVFFDFDYNTSFRDLDIEIDGGMSTGSSTATWIYGNTARVKGDDFEDFSFVPSNYIFSLKKRVLNCSCLR